MNRRNLAPSRLTTRRGRVVGSLLLASLPLAIGCEPPSPSAVDSTAAPTASADPPAAGPAALAPGPTPGLEPGDTSQGADNFHTSDRVDARRVTFPNQYRMDVVGTLFVPKSLHPARKAPAMVVGHPMGAVKEQSAGLYATKMAEQGFVTLSIDLSFWGESEGQPRNLVAPEIYVEDFSAAVDFLRTQPLVDRERIGALGICGSGSFVIAAAKIDPRIKAIATVSTWARRAATACGAPSRSRSGERGSRRPRVSATWSLRAATWPSPAARRRS